MLSRRIVCLLTVVLALGAASAAPLPRVRLSGDIFAIACLAEQRCERQETPRMPRQIAQTAPIPAALHYQAPQTDRVHWPSSYQRPPTRNSLL
jgi:hypothetical protein